MPEPSRVQCQVYVERSADEVFSYFADPAHWGRMTPDPDPDTVVSGGSGVLEVGAVVTLSTARSGRLESMTLLVEECDGTMFVERQLSGPFAHWVLRRRVAPFQSGALVNEQVEFRPGGALVLLPERLVKSGPIERWLGYRQQSAKRILEQLMRVRGVSTIR